MAIETHSFPWEKIHFQLVYRHGNTVNTSNSASCPSKDVLLPEETTGFSGLGFRAGLGGLRIRVYGLGFRHLPLKPGGFRV